MQRRAREKAHAHNGMRRRSQPGEHGRPPEYLIMAGGVSKWINESKAPDAAPGFDKTSGPKGSLSELRVGVV